MRKLNSISLTTFLFFLFLNGMMRVEAQQTPGSGGAGGVLYVTTAPSGSCPANARVEKLINGGGSTYTCQSISGGTGTWGTLSSSGASGTVTSIAQTVPTWLTVTGSPITTSGTIAISATTGQTSHEVIGTCGTATSFAPCALVSGDLPAALSSQTSVNGTSIPSSVTWPVTSAATTHKWINSFTQATGAFTETQPASTDLSDYGSVSFSGLLGTPNIAVGTLSATGQITSTLAIGTAPFVVTSTTPVANLSIGGNAATATKWATARNLAGNSVDGSADVAFSNKFIVQGTTDAGLSGAQFLGALSTGLVKVTTGTGVLSNGAASDVVGLVQGLTGCNTANYVFVPQGSNCVAQTSGTTGSNYALGVYPLTTGGVGPATGLATDSTGNNLNVPATIAIGGPSPWIDITAAAYGGHGDTLLSTTGGTSTTSGTTTVTTGGGTATTFASTDVGKLITFQSNGLATPTLGTVATASGSLTLPHACFGITAIRDNQTLPITTTGPSINGESLMTAENCSALTSQEITMTAPTLPSGATGYRVYFADENGTYSEVSQIIPGTSNAICSSQSTQNVTDGACDPTATLTINAYTYIGFFPPLTSGWLSTIATYNSAHSVTITDTIPSDISGNTAPIAWGTANDAAFTAALAACPKHGSSPISATSGCTIYFPPTNGVQSPTGRYAIQNSLLVAQGGVKVTTGGILGQGLNSGGLITTANTGGVIEVFGRSYGLKFGSSTQYVETGGAEYANIHDAGHVGYGGIEIRGSGTTTTDHLYFTKVDTADFVSGPCWTLSIVQIIDVTEPKGNCLEGIHGEDFVSNTKWTMLDFDGISNISGQATTGSAWCGFFSSNPATTNVGGNNQLTMPSCRDFYMGGFREKNLNTLQVSNVKAENINLTGGASCSGGTGTACYGTFFQVDDVTNSGRAYGNLMVGGAVTRYASLFNFGTNTKQNTIWHPAYISTISGTVCTDNGTNDDILVENSVIAIGGNGCPNQLANGLILNGLLTTNASATSGAGLNIPPGTAPTSPNNGDFWSTSSGFYGRVNGATVGPFGTSTGGDTITSPNSTLSIGGTSTNTTLDINLGNANTWTALQTFGTHISIGGVTAAGATGTSNVVFSNSPTLVTPALGTPASGVITNLTGSCTNCGSNTVNSAASTTNSNYSILAGSGTSGQQEPSTIANFTINPSTGATAIPGALSVSGSVTTSSASLAGLLALGGNTSNPSIPSNSAGWLGPASASFTSYVCQFPSTAPSGNQVLECGTPSSGISTGTWATPGTGTVSVVSSGSLTSTALVTGGGTTTLQTPSATSTLSSSGVLQLAAGGSIGSADTGTPKFTFSSYKMTATGDIVAAASAAGATGYASLNIPSGSAPTTNIASGDVWNLSGILQFYDGTHTNSVTTIQSPPTSGHLATFSGTSGLLTDGGAVPTGTVTSVATTSPITGGTFTTSGTIACATCVTSTAALTNNAVVIGGGGQASSTISADTTTTHALFATAGAPAFRAIATGDLPTGIPIGNVGTAGLSGTSPMAISAAGAISCATCVTSAASLTSTALMTGAGSQGSQTPSATSTLSSAGALQLAAGGSVASADTGTPIFTFSANKVAFTSGTATSTLFDLSGITGTAGFKLPQTTSNTASAAGVLDFDTTNKDYHAYVNGADSKIAVYPTSLTPTASQCATWVAAGSAWTLGSAACGSGGSGGSLDQITGAAAQATGTETAAGHEYTFAGVETANLTSPFSFTDANSTNNNTNGAVIIGTTGTSTGAVPLRINEATAAGDFLDAWSTGTVSNGVLSGGTKLFALTATGEGQFGASPPNPTTGTSGGAMFGCGSAPTGIAANGTIYCNSSNLPDLLSGTTDLGAVASESSIIGANTIPKAAGTTAQLSTSSIADNGTDVITTEPILGGNTTVLTANGTTTSATFAAFTTNSLVLPVIPATQKRYGHCDLMWQASSTSDAIELGLNTSATSTGFQILESLTYMTTGTPIFLLPPAAATTATTTAVTASTTPAGTGTSYLTHVTFSLQSNTNPQTITVEGQIASGGTLTLVAGSACGWGP
jgi:hypothetical protein